MEEDDEIYSEPVDDDFEEEEVPEEQLSEQPMNDKAKPESN